MTTLDQKQAVNAVKKHGSVNAAAHALGIPRSTFSRRLNGRPAGTPRLPRNSPPARGGAACSAGGVGGQVGFTREDFKKRYDKDYIIPNRIRDALKKLGATRYLPELEFMRLAGISHTDMGTYREGFEAYVVMVERTKRLWCGSPALAAELRGDANG